MTNSWDHTNASIKYRYKKRYADLVAVEKKWATHGYRHAIEVYAAKYFVKHLKASRLWFDQDKAIRRLLIRHKKEVEEFAKMRMISYLKSINKI